MKIGITSSLLAGLDGLCMEATTADKFVWRSLSKSSCMS